MRHLDHFRIQLSPTEDGTLEVARWDDGALDDIPGNEYPLLYRAYCRANAAPFARTAESEEPILMHLKAEFERNTEIIRQDLRLELQRFGQREGSPKAKTARATPRDGSVMTTQSPRWENRTAPYLGRETGAGFRSTNCRWCQ